MARLGAENVRRAREVIGLYPHPRSALIPVLHIAQEQDGWLTPDGIEHVAELLDLTPAEVYGTATFYDMLFTHPVGKYLVSICTNIACLLNGGYELLEHAEERLGVKAGGTTADGRFTLEDVECIALCGDAPCLAVNWRFFGNVSNADFDQLIADLGAGALDTTVPPHGTLCRVRRNVGLRAKELPDVDVYRIQHAEAADPEGKEAEAQGRPDPKAPEKAVEAERKAEEEAEGDGNGDGGSDGKGGS